MDSRRCIKRSEDSEKPIFSFARIRRCATVESDQPSPRHHVSSSSSTSCPSSGNHGIRPTTTSSSLSSLDSNFSCVLYHRSNTGVGMSANSSGSSSQNHSFENAPSSTSSSSSTSPTHNSSQGLSNSNQVRGRALIKNAIDTVNKANSKVSKKSNRLHSASTFFTESSSSQSLSSCNRSSSIPPFSSFDNFSCPPSVNNTSSSPKQGPLNKNSQSALAFSSISTHSKSQKEKPIFRRYLSLIIFPSSLKQIPFMVPTTPHGMCSRSSFRRSDQKSLDDGSPSGKSEPTSPTSSMSVHGGKRPSVEIPGAYALGTIDPSLYKVADEDDHYDIPAGHIGRVWFATEYERETEKLMVTLIKAKNLPSRTQGSDNACDPFVRLYLMPDERRYLQSKCRKKTCNPKFEETYVFQVSHRALEDRVLKLTVYDVDRHKRHQVIGHALYPLREHDCENNVRLVIWRDLEKEVSESTTSKGDLLVSLCYNNHMERLTVGVFESRDLHCSESMGQHLMDTYTKVCLMTQNRLVKVKKTETVKKTTCPNFNESFTFKVPASSLDNASVNIAVMEHLSGLKDRPVGRIVLGSFMFARGKELEHWNQMIANQREQISHWHTLS